FVVGMSVKRLLVAIAFHRVIAIEVLSRSLPLSRGEPALFRTADFVDRMQAFQNHLAGCCAYTHRAVRSRTEYVDLVEQSLNAAQKAYHRFGTLHIRQLQIAAHFKPIEGWLEIRRRIILPKNHLDSLPDQIPRDRIGTLELPFIFQLDLSGNRRQGGINIGNAWNDLSFPCHNGPPFGIADDILETGNGQPLTHAGTLVDPLIRPCLERYCLHDFFDEFGQKDLPAGISADPGFLFGDRDAVLERDWIVRFDLGSDSILQGCNDLASRSVVLRVRREHEHHIERKTYRVTLNLHVAFLHDVE